MKDEPLLLLRSQIQQQQGHYDCGKRRRDQNIEAAKNEILNQLEEMKQGNFTEEELQSAKLSVCNSYRTIGDYLGSTESWYISQIFMPDTQTPEQAAEISKVTREEIIAATKSNIGYHLPFGWN